MTSWKLNVPVAFMIFNRPDTTKRVFAAIAKARPPKLLIVADGPRISRPGEEEKCAAARAIATAVDWDCEVLTNFSDVNLGCKRRVSSGLDWVFEQVEEAIVLEDDCLPDESFFRFCEELLARYRDNEEIMIISGFNFEEKTPGNSSYFFSSYPHIWGWASWRRVWKHYDVDMSDWPEWRMERDFQKRYTSKREMNFWTRSFERIRSGQLDTWDAQVNYIALRTKKLAVFPRSNLITNIGFGEDATHTKFQPKTRQASGQEIAFPLKHPENVVVDRAWDKRRVKHEFMMPGALWRTASLVKHVLIHIRPRHMLHPVRSLKGIYRVATTRG